MLTATSLMKERPIKEAPVRKARPDAAKKFIEKSKLIHGDLYSYDKVVYFGRLDKVIITCKTHGDFEQRPANHLSGYKCRECADEKLRTSKEGMVKKARLKHGNKFNYDKSEFKTLQDIIIIVCPVHGEFKQRASNHLVGYGCKKCGKITQRNKRNARIN